MHISFWVKTEQAPFFPIPFWKDITNFAIILTTFFVDGSVHINVNYKFDNISGNSEFLSTNKKETHGLQPHITAHVYFSSVKLYTILISCVFIIWSVLFFRKLEIKKIGSFSYLLLYKGSTINRWPH